jgi:DNA-binding MarR family transcriptional regulator
MPTTATTNTAAMAGRLRISATRLARTLRRQADIGLSPSQLTVLTTIDIHGPISLGALAEHERVAPPSITKAVAKLEAAGYVTRETDPTDRRVARVRITSAGAALLDESRKRKDAWLAARLAGLSPDERERLAAALDVLETLT